MSEMVERVAMAIWPTAFDGDGAGWHQRRQVAMDQARAAIEEMRSVTGQATAAGQSFADIKQGSQLISRPALISRIGKGA